MDSLDSGGGLGWPKTSRPRVNSAIDVAGFLSQVRCNRMNVGRAQQLGQFPAAVTHTHTHAYTQRMNSWFIHVLETFDRTLTSYQPSCRFAATAGKGATNRLENWRKSLGSRSVDDRCVRTEFAIPISWAKFISNDDL